uniref:Uncharacterized protein n=1 Tax=Ixodes scapularis TaxID=6945 RepID=A0A4D5S680_IXOSC
MQMFLKTLVSGRFLFFFTHACFVFAFFSQDAALDVNYFVFAFFFFLVFVCFRFLVWLVSSHTLPQVQTPGRECSLAPCHLLLYGGQCSKSLCLKGISRFPNVLVCRRSSPPFSVILVAFCFSHIVSLSRLSRAACVQMMSKLLFLGGRGVVGNFVLSCSVAEHPLGTVMRLKRDWTRELPQPF